MKHIPDGVSDDGEIGLIASIEELRAMSSAINEALEAVEEWEFQTRLGVTREYLKGVRADIRAILHGTAPRD